MDCRDRILSNEFFDVITDYPLRTLEREGYDACYANIEDLFNIVYINRRDVSEAESYFFQYRSVPKLYGLMQEAFDPNSLIESGILRAQQPPLDLSGQGVVICFIDTGIEYTNPVFLDEAGNSRILAIWDQTIQTGVPPEGFYFGTEYKKEEIDRALRSDNPTAIVPSRDENGHGSAMAGVAAGSRVEDGNDYLGAAPDAEIVVVKLKECKQYMRDFYLVPEGVPAYAENDIMLAVQYADGFAEQFRRPVVICLGLGTSYGDHNGNLALSQYLNVIARKRSRAVVVCGGNEGNADHHFQGEMSRLSGNAANSVPVEIRVGENAKGFLLELWGNVPDVFTVSVRSPGGETVPSVRLGVQGSVTYEFVYERTQITVAGVLVEPTSGQELVVLRVQDPTPGIWTIRVEAVGEISNGNFHLWLPITQFLNTAVYFLEPSPYVTLTEPAMAPDVISVSTYNAANNSFYINSGRGFTANGRIKPDFAAPGVDVPTIRGNQSGSSLAAAMTAGAVAQFLQWAVVEGNDNVVASREIKNYLIRGAERSADLSYPNREWGYGRLNIAGAFDALIGV